jgi:hypothetical protein
MPFQPDAKGRKWNGQDTEAPSHCQPPRGGSQNVHAGTAWALAGLRTYRLARRVRSSFLLTHASRSMREQCCCGCSFLLTDAGQSRNYTGFPLGVPPAGTATSELPQYMVWIGVCQD